MFDKCPGIDEIRRPTIQIKKCPNCGANVELFSDDVKVPYDRCGFIVYNDIESCIQWCKLAKECVGEELYHTLIERKRKVE